MCSEGKRWLSAQCHLAAACRKRHRQTGRRQLKCDNDLWRHRLRVGLLTWCLPPKTPLDRLLMYKTLKPHTVPATFLLVFMFIIVTHQTCTHPLPACWQQVSSPDLWETVGSHDRMLQRPLGSSKYRGITTQGQGENSLHLLEVNKIKYPCTRLCSFKTACNVPYRFYKGTRAS